MNKFFYSALVIFVLFCTLPAFSQDDAGETSNFKFGITGSIYGIGYSPLMELGVVGLTGPDMAIGFRMHIANLVMIDPYAGFMNSKQVPDGGDSDTRNYYDFGGGIYYTNVSSSSFLMYVGPKIDYSLQDRKDNDRTITIMFISLRFGIQYSFNKHVAISTDLGLGFGSANDDNAGSETKTDFFRTVRPGLTAILYF